MFVQKVKEKCLEELECQELEANKKGLAITD